MMMFKSIYVDFSPLDNIDLMIARANRRSKR